MNSDKNFSMNEKREKELREYLKSEGYSKEDIEEIVTEQAETERGEMPE